MNKVQIKQNASGKFRVEGKLQVGNAKDLPEERARGLHEGLLVPVLMYGAKTMAWKRKEWSRNIVIQMTNFWSLLSIIVGQSFCDVKMMDERTKGVLLCFGHNK